jgi:hypothetical protein
MSVGMTCACSWMAYEKPMNDAHEEEKSHKQGGANRTYSWPRERCLEIQKEAVIHK